MRALVLAFTIVFSPAFAVAQSGQQKQAEKHFNEAQKLYNAGQYDQAVKEFLQAYTLVPVNPLLFNIGQAYRLSGDEEKALSYYEKYVSFEPNGAQVPEAREHIRVLQERVETARREREATEAEQRTKEEQERMAREEEERKRAAAENARRLAEVRSEGSGLRTGGLVVGGLGVAALGVGVALGASDSFDGKSVALMAGGGAALVAGGVMYVLGVKKRSAAEARLRTTSLIVPQVTDHAFGVSWITIF